jgi:peptide/nickel transport system permease protein
MKRYILQRFLIIAPLLFVVAVLSFLLVDFIPGSAAETMLGDQATPENVAALEELMGLNDPFLERFGRWFSRALVGDLGTGIRTGLPVAEMIWERLPATLSIVSGGLFIGILFGLTTGIWAALRPGSVLDRSITMMTSVTVAIPSFWLGLMLAIWFGVERDWFPAIGYAPLTEEGLFEWGRHIILPSLSLAFPTAALISRQTRSSMTNVLQSKYVQAARANGLPRRRIVEHHVLRNAMIPVVTVIGFRVAVSIGQAFVVERVFALGGVGDLLAEAVLKQDVPVIQGGLLFTALLVAITSLLVDVSYALLNPKVRLS